MEWLVSRFIGFAPAAIDALKKGSLLDPSTPGLRIVALESGKKKWKYHRRVVEGDKVVKATLGQFPEMILLLLTAVRISELRNVRITAAPELLRLSGKCKKSRICRIISRN
jgi:hypothetical protein